MQMARNGTALQPIGDAIRTPDKVPIVLSVNGVEARLEVAPWTSLLDALRDRLDLTGTKKGATTANAAPAPYWLTAGASIRV